MSLGCSTKRGHPTTVTPQHSTFILVSLWAFTALAIGQNKGKTYPPKLEGAKVTTYKSVDGVDLKLYHFEPAGLKATDSRPAVVFYFGGGWKGGNPSQFEQHCRYLASRGMVAFTADYRVLSRHKAKAKVCVTDGKSAIRWIRLHAKELGIDPNRIVAGGGSAGGHIAACTGIISGFEEPGEDYAVSSRPNALALFNPAVVLAPVQGESFFTEEKLHELDSRMGVPSDNLSPFHHVTSGIPPTIIFHGTADTTVPFRTVEIFATAMSEAGNRCELHPADQQTHGYFNFNRSGNRYFGKTMKITDSFLQSLGYLEGKNTVDAYLSSLKTD
jgi:acetyl esterase